MNTDAAGTGNAGNIFIETNTLNVSSGSTLASNSLDEGSAGLIEIQASDRALFDNARVFSEIETTAVTPAVGNREGDIDVLASQHHYLGKCKKDNNPKCPRLSPRF
jgi:large exoprotein involved in heme utilization and adhesion